MKLREREIGVGLNAPTKPVECLKVCVGHQLGHPHNHEPKKGTRVARGQSQRFLNMCLDFVATPQRVFSKPDEPMRISQIPIEGQRLLTFSDTLGSAVCPDLNRAKEHMSSGVVRHP